MQTKFKISTTLRNILLNDTSVTDIVSNRIFPLYAEKDTAQPFIVYQRDEYSKDYSKMGIYSETAKVVFTIVDDNYDRGCNLAEIVNNCLEGYHEDKLRIRLIDSTEEIAENLFLQVLLFEIN